MQVLSDLDLQVRILTLRGGKDPDEIIKTKGKEFFQSLLDASETGLDFRLNEILRKYDLSVESEKVQCCGEVFDLLASVPSPAQREIYGARAAKDLSLSAEAVQQEVRVRMRRQARLRRKQEEQAEANRLRGVGDRINPQRMTYLRAARAEEDLLSVLLAWPEKAGAIKAAVPPEDFVTDFNRRVYLALLDQLEQPTAAEPGAFLSQYFNPDEMGRIMGFVASCEALNADDAAVDRAVEILKEEKKKITERAAGGESLLAENLQRLRDKRNGKKES